MNAPIVVVDYNPNWPAQFEELRAPLSTALGALALRIEHVGSTSVPGLAAKPIIDIDVVIGSREHLEHIVQSLAKLGYIHQGDLGVTGREAFKRTHGNVPEDGRGRLWPEHHLYVCAKDSPELLRHLAFRDYLRDHPEQADAYARLKMELAIKFRDDRGTYNEAKTKFVEKIYQLAGANVDAHQTQAGRPAPH